MVEIMRACIAMHNMIIESERDIDDHSSYLSPTEYLRNSLAPVATVQDPLSQHPPSLARLICLESQLRNAQVHSDLRRDLVEHLWAT